MLTIRALVKHYWSKLCRYVFLKAMLVFIIIDVEHSFDILKMSSKVITAKFTQDPELMFSTLSKFHHLFISTRGVFPENFSFIEIFGLL